MGDIAKEKITNELEDDNKTKGVFDGAKKIIDATGNFAKINKLPPEMSLSLYCFMGFLIFSGVIILIPIDIKAKYFSIVIGAILLVVVLAMTFSLYKTKLRLGFREKRKDK